MSAGRSSKMRLIKSYVNHSDNSKVEDYVITYVNNSINNFSNFIKNYIDNKPSNIQNLTNDNNVIYSKINLTEPFIAYGDSYTEGDISWNPTWPTILSQLTGKNVVNLGKGGTGLDYLQLNTGKDNNISRDPILNANLNRTSIIMYGFNDVRRSFASNTYTLYKEHYVWTQMCLATALMLSAPQSKFIDPRTFTKTGISVNTPVYNYGVAISGTNPIPYIEKNIGTARYIAVRHTIISDFSANWEMKVNGEVVNIYKRSIAPKTPEEGYISIAYVVDLGENKNNCMLRLTNKSINESYVDWVLAFSDNDITNGRVNDSRDTLFMTIPRFSEEDYTTIPVEQSRILYNEAFETVARICRRIGLPVSVFKIRDITNNMVEDNVHPSPYLSKAWANDLKKYAIL